MRPGAFLVSWWLVGFVLSLGPVVAVAGSPATESQVPRDRWVEVTRLDSESRARLFSFAPEEAGVLRLDQAGSYLLCTGGEHFAAGCRTAVLSSATLVALDFEEGAGVTGTVTVGREPAAEVTITVVPAHLETVRYVSVPLTWDPDARQLQRRVSTAADGRFELPPLAAGDYLLEIHLAGGRLEHYGPWTLPDPKRLLRGSGKRENAPQAQLELGELTFATGVGVEVRVISDQGGPVPRARVGAAQGARPEETVFFETEADEDGKAVLRGLDPALPLSLTCQAAHYRFERRMYEAPPALHLCELESLASLKGRVVDGDGQVLDAVVTLGSAGSESVDDDGRFAFEDLAAGTYMVLAAAAGAAAEEREARLPPGVELDLGEIVLRPGVSWQGRVVDGDDGGALAGARVESLRPPGVVLGTTDDEGLFSAVSGAGGLRLEVSATGFAARSFDLTAEDLTADEPVELRLHRGGWVQVRRWRDDGEPCAGCSIQIEGNGDAASLRTDAEGLAVSGPLLLGTYDVTPVDLRSFGSVVTRSGGSEYRRVEVRPGQVTKVEIGRPRRHVEVRWSPAPPSDWHLLVRSSRETSSFSLGDAGEAEVPWPAAAVDLLLGDGAGRTVLQRSVAADFRGDHLDLPLPEGAAAGTLIDEGGEPVRGARVELLAVDAGTLQAAAWSNEAGRFVLPFLPPGAYLLSVEGRPLRALQVGRRAVDAGELEATKPSP